MTKTSARTLRISIVVLGVALWAASALAQETDDLAARANAAIQASDWGKAVELYSEVTRVKPDDPTAWYRLGLATSNSGGAGPAARAAFEKALALGFAPPAGHLALARSFVKDGQPEAALETLEKLAALGPARFVASQLESDEAFGSLRSDKRFQAVATRLIPCTGPEYHQFDFWLGSWIVVSPQGRPLGTNNVTRSMDGCLLIENWTSGAGGGKGMSLNYYDRDKGTWSQIYRDNSGNITQWPELVGGLVDGAMVLDSGPAAQPRTRWTWTRQSDGRVRQMAESTTDGKAWTVVWDSYYVLADD